MGLATAWRFLDEGAAVVVGDLNEGDGAAFIDEAAERGVGERARFVRADVSQEADIEHLVGVASTDFGRLDAVFNNAGVGVAFGPITEIEVDDWDYPFAVLCRGVFLGIKHGARALRVAGGSSIINTASVAALSGGAGPLAYSAAKAAVVNLTKS